MGYTAHKIKHLLLGIELQKKSKEEDRRFKQFSRFKQGSNKQARWLFALPSK